MDKLVIDVRDNGGGNNTLNRPIVHGIIKRDRLNRRGHLFVITGRATFSAAQNFVNEMEKHTNVIFADEQSGARPNHYGDPTPVKLPNSGLEIRVSTLWWQDMHPADDREGTMPHIAVESSFADYVAGKDPVLDAVRQFRTMTVVLEEALPEGAAAIRTAYRQFRTNPAHAGFSTDAEVVSLAPDLAARKRLDDAVLLATMNVETYGESAPAHKALGDLLLEKGQRSDAIREYERALQFEPRNPYYREVLEKLRPQAQ